MDRRAMLWTLRLWLADKAELEPNRAAEIKQVLASSFGLQHLLFLVVRKTGEPANLVAWREGLRQNWPYLKRQGFTLVLGAGS